MTILFNELDTVVAVYLPLVIEYSKRPIGINPASANTFSQRVNAFKASIDKAVAGDSIAEALARPVLEHLDFAKAISAKRNEYVHAVALVDFQTNQRLLRMRKGEAVPDEAEMLDIAMKSAVVADKFAEHCEALLREFIAMRG